MWRATLVCATLVCVLAPGAVQARGPIPPAVFQAVRTYWTSPQERRRAFDVAWCESRFKTAARNGQYLGLFQMGADERTRFGHGPDPWSQARAARRYFNYALRVSGYGWRPWECRP